ncbi:dihydrolipoyl dehydrogenase [Billgrantia gudaonensis]|uniref:Dihydrolipoyl dehydrogenase n=1 Tax=Billgrantia gudaonensis TaxID=376427 RepID=A0A1G9E966_9GAMM|nr:dihydrolipoyl dehydrogenase [Halomonas gudaonensis]SDK72606.1 dihydrolipoamide dehydrogenase [Halomonas gudaonensis]
MNSEQSRPEQAQLLVLGGGPGGYTAAFRAADLGLDVVLVEREATLGGVCLNVGCIPSKALLHTAHIMDQARGLTEQGIDFGEPDLSLDKLRGWKESVVSKLTQGLAGLARQRGVRVLRGEGRFTGPDSLVVHSEDGARELRFSKAIIAAGSRPARLPFLSEDPRILDSTAALELEDIPERLLVLGGGIIGLEMAAVYAALGSRITVVEQAEGLLPGCDRDLVEPLRKDLEQRYEALYTGTRVAGVQPQACGLKVSFECDRSPEVFDKLLCAVGRLPNGGLLDADKAGVRVDDQGFIAVDEFQRTNVPHVFAIGDLAGGPMLAHKAAHEGKVAAEVAAGLPVANEARVIPSVAYTDPEVAWVGLTETQAQRENRRYEKACFPWMASGRAQTLGAGAGLTKILVEPDSGVLIGAGIVGPSAGDLIAEATLAIELGLEPAEIGLTVHPHPTLAETLAFAAEAYEGTLTELYLGGKTPNT